MNEYANGLLKFTVSDKEMALRKDQKKSYNFQLKSSTDQITKTVQKFDELLDGMNCCSSRDKSELSTALSEALANAIIHGNKTQSQKKVDVKIQLFSDKIKINVEDQGKGFDPQKIESPLKPENLKKTNGRGIYLMTLFMDDVSFKKNKNGMKVTLIKNLQKKY
ncbi:ATP-binding protein [candidate division KSB1 bacterium]|nr:ATP-binding protein [candidate division KSB1 bacterium]